MSDFAGKFSAIGRWHLAKRPLSVLPVDFSVSRVTGGSLEGFEKFRVSDRDGLAPDRASFERAILQRVVYPSGKGLLQSFKAIEFE